MQKDLTFLNTHIMHTSANIQTTATATAYSAQLKVALHINDLTKQKTDLQSNGNHEMLTEIIYYISEESSQLHTFL